MRYENRTFDGETVRLDDCSFSNCHFKNCVLLFAGGGFEAENLQITDSTLKMEGAAQNAQEVFLHFMAAAAESAPEGSIFSIGGKHFKQVELPDNLQD